MPTGSSVSWTKSRLLRPLVGSTIVGVVIVVAVAVVALRTLTDADPEMWWARIDGLWFVGGVACFVLGNLLVGHRFLVLLPETEGERPGPWRVGSLFFAGHVFTLAIPGPAGDVAAVAALRARYGVDVGDSLVTTIHTRLIGLFTSALIAACVLPWVPLDDLVGRVLALACVVIAAGAVVLGLLTARPALLRALGGWIVERVRPEARGAMSWLLRRGGQQVSLFADSLCLVASAPLSRWLAVVGWSLAIQLVHLGALVCACQALGLEPTLAGMILARGMGSLTMLAVFLVPGGLGSYEAVFVASMVGAGGLALIEAGLLVLSMRLIHLLGLALSGFAFAAWARVLLSSDVAEAIEGGSAHGLR